MNAPVRPPADVVTFGCRLNAYESEAIRAQAAADGVTNAVVFNTCAVTGEAVRQARQAIRKARRERPGARLIVTGCAAQIDPDAFAKMPEVDLVLGNAEKAAPGALAETARVRVNDIMSLRETAHHMVGGLKDRARAYVEVQNGCDHRCTFCVIPYGRGNSRSAPAGEVVEQVRLLAAEGYREVVLTGVDITSWGADLPGEPTLGQLVARILRLVPDLRRLRLSSIDAAEIDPDLMRCLATEERLAPYLHLSLQHGDDLILKRMKRRHLRADALKLVEEVRAVRPDVAFGADLIAGFPTETDEAFDNTVRLVEEAGLSFLHVFPFSPRPGTPAARMPQLSRAVIKDRARRLRAAGEAALVRHLERQSGRTLSGLVEKDGVARAADFTEIAFTGDAAAGEIAAFAVTGHDGKRVLAEGGLMAEKKGWFSRLTAGLSRTSQQMTEQVTSVLTKKPLDQEQLDALEEMLIEADLGPAAAASITQRFAESRFGKQSTEDEVREALADAVAHELIPREGVFDPLSGPRPYVVLFIGVNGSGKTTTLGKIAADLTGKGAKVLIAAGDTFRAAAVEQLKIWADRAKADFMSRPTGADAAGLAFDALEQAKRDGTDVVLIDTAGRLQNKQDLMNELLKVIRVVKKLSTDAPHETLLVLDATVGRNALAQEKIFGNQIGVSGIVMTKLDGTARGGVLVPVAQASDSPIKLIGVGEGIEDLQPFDARAFSRSLVGLESQ